MANDPAVSRNFSSDNLSKIRDGFDHVVTSNDGSVTIILDSKQIKSSGATRVGTSKAGAQLSEEHIRSVVERLSDGEAKTVLSNALDEGAEIRTAVIGVDKTTGNVLFTPVNVK